MPAIHTFDSTDEAYDASQTDDDIANGDLLVVKSEKVIGFLHEAWPTAVVYPPGKPGEFHIVDPNHYDEIVPLSVTERALELALDFGWLRDEAGIEG